jgi:hypothetical protein
MILMNGNRYTTILSQQKKNDDSLMRLVKKGRQGLSFFSRTSSSPSTGTGTGEEGEGDGDKVKTQMRLDIMALGKDAESLGVSLEESEAFQGLKLAMEDDPVVK